MDTQVVGRPLDPPYCFYQSPYVSRPEAGRPTVLQRFRWEEPVLHGYSWGDRNDYKDLHGAREERILTEEIVHGATKVHIAGDLHKQMWFGDVTEKEASLCGRHVWTGGCKNPAPLSEDGATGRITWTMTIVGRLRLG